MTGLNVRSALILVGGAVAVLILANFLPPFYQRIATLLLVSVLFGMAFNFALGIAGMVSFGHGALFGLGTYTVAILMRDTPMSFVSAIPIAFVVAALGGTAMALLGTRTVGLYFGILTLALGQVLYLIVFQWYDFTGGDNGIFGVPLDYWVRDPGLYLQFTAIAVAVLLLAILAMSASPFGATLMAIRDHESRVEYLGVNVKAMRITAFTLSAGLSGVAGALFAGVDGMAFPLLLHWSTSARPVIMALVGGVYSFFGPAVGAIVLVGFETGLGQVTEHWLLFVGLLLLGVVLFMPTGVVGLWRRPSGGVLPWKRRQRSRPVDSASRSEGSPQPAKSASR